MRRRFFSNRFDYMILYTSTDGNIVTPYSLSGFNQIIKSNIYNQIGKITFMGPFSIGPIVFMDCSNLETIIIPNSITSIGNYAFSRCTSLTSITIPDSVTSIGDSALSDCQSLTSVTIPDSVTSIGLDAFYGCSSLTSVYCKATTPPAGNSNMFSRNASGRKIYVPLGSVNAYKSATNWSEYADSIVGYNF